MQRTQHAMPVMDREPALSGASSRSSRNDLGHGTDDTDHDVQTAERLARSTGLLYLLIAIFGMFAGTVTTNLVVAGDGVATADNILASLALLRGGLVAWIAVLFADIAVAITLLVLLKPVSPTLSLLAAAFRVVYVAIQGINLLNLFNALLLLTNPNYAAGFGPGQVNALALVSLEAFGTGFRIGLIFFGVHLIALGYLLFTSRYVPRVISSLVVAAGIGYSADSLGRLSVPDYSAVATAVLLTPAVAGELALTVWFLAKGVQLRRPAQLQHEGQGHAQAQSVSAV